MRKKDFKILVVIFCSLFFVSNVNAATTLKTLKDQYQKDLARSQTSIKKQKEAKQKIIAIQGELSEISNKINQYEKNIADSKEKIKTLDKEITEKKQEIDSLLSFLQISDGDNVYLEYIFGASSFTDFIYRSAVVEQLTKHNDELIDDMYKKIEENKKLQKKLRNDIELSEKEIDSLEVTLKKQNLTMKDLIEDHEDIQEDLKASKKELDYYTKQYKKYGCSENTTISDCIKIDNVSGFVRPLVRGTVTSNYGLRYHPTLHYYRMHNGVDLGVSMGTNVYSAASGVVTKIVRVSNPGRRNSSCGGNMVYVKHKMNGVEYRTVYMHLHTIKVKIGDYVTASTVLGTSGGGESYDYCTTGPHLHFGMLKGWSGSNYVNPRNYVSLPSLGGRFTTRF